MDDPKSNPMGHPPEQVAGAEGSPRFGRLLIVLVCAVLLVAGITMLSERLYS